MELTPDIHICGICKQQFNNLDAFVAHKQSGCQLTGTSGAAPSTVQFVSEETVPATQTQTTTRTITSETQTITGMVVGWGSHSDPVHHQLPEFTQTHIHRVSDAIEPSHPLSSSSCPALSLSQHQGLFK